MIANAVLPRFRNVFVLCTGRSGSQTFIRACEHFTNYTAGHETLSRELGAARMEYPAGHIEADNRLSWFLGRLEQRFGDEAVYVHLKRDPSKVAASYDRRWDHRFSLVDAYNHSILMQSNYNVGAAADMVETISANTDMFLAGKTHVIEIDIDVPEEGFRRFADLIRATGDMDAAVAEFLVRHNRDGAPQPTSKDKRLRLRLVELQEKFAEEREKRISMQVALQELEGKYKKFKKWAICLALPTLLVLSPIWVPVVFAKNLRRKSRKKKRPTTTLVYDAFHKRQREGPEAAIAALTDAAGQIPPGTIALFRAIDADSDDAWLALKNQWTSARGLPQLSLLTGAEPRFQRLVFAAVDPVDAPDLVTVIIPCYNAEAAVRQAIQSILNQSWRNIEVIAVNDASSDGTGDVLDEMATEDNRLRVLHNICNVGPYVSKNRAFNLASGAYVTGHDSDDIAVPDRIAWQMASLKASKGAKATIGYMVRLTEAGAFTTPEKSAGRTYDGIARLCPVSTLCETVSLREMFGGWDSVRFGADSELIERMELVLGGQFVRSNSITMLCLSTESNLTNHPETGIGTPTGISPVRAAYKKAYQEWHLETPHRELSIPFPHDPRSFEAPEKMQVPVDDVRRLIEAASAELS